MLTKSRTNIPKHVFPQHNYFGFFVFFSFYFSLFCSTGCNAVPQQTIICSNSTIEILQKGIKYVQRRQ